MTFASPLTDQAVVEHEPVTFLCKLSKPGKAVKWYKDGKPLPEINRKGHYFMGIQDIEYTLHIQDPGVHDSGEYKAKVGEQESSARLKVTGMKIQS